MNTSESLEALAVTVQRRRTSTRERNWLVVLHAKPPAWTLAATRRMARIDWSVAR